MKKYLFCLVIISLIQGCANNGRSFKQNSLEDQLRASQGLPLRQVNCLPHNKYSISGGYGLKPTPDWDLTPKGV